MRFIFVPSHYSKNVKENVIQGKSREKNVDNAFQQVLRSINKKREVPMKLKSLFCVSLCLSILLLACSNVSAQAEKLRIGLLVALTGWFSAAGTAELDEATVIADMINEKGGVIVGGKKYLIELVPEDMKSTHEGVTAALNKLIYDKKIRYVAGPTAFWGPASAPLCEANKILNAIGYCANTPGELDKTTKYRILAENGTMGHIYAMLKYIKKAHPNVKTVAIVNPDDGSIPYLKPLIKRALEVGDIVTYPNELVDFSPIASKLAARKADAIFNPNAIGTHVGSILKGLRELGDNRWYFYCGVATCSVLKGLAGAAAKNVVSMGIMQNAKGNPPQLQEFLVRYFKKVGEERSLIFQNSECVYALAQVIQNAQSLDPDVIMKKFVQMDKVETIYGTGRVCGEKTYGVKQAIAHPLPVQYIDEKGEIKFYGWITDVYVP
jgi:branched-chain amino acid transport system substrate-binding protein